MGDCGDIITRLEELYQNPLAAYSTRQLEEELTRRCREHVALRLKVKLRLLHSCRKMWYRRRKASENIF